jgi:cell division protein FtsB
VKKLKAFYKIIKPFINKYTITIGAFALLMSFGQYSFINRFKLLRNETALEKEKKQYDDQIEKAKLELQQLNTNKNNLERLAREKYLMRKKNEDVFLIQEDGTSPSDSIITH